MSSIPLPALDVRPPADPLESVGRLMALKSMMGQQQVQQQQVQGAQLENQQRQVALNDQQATTAAMKAWDGKDINELPSLILKNGGSSTAVFGAKNQITTLTKNAAEADGAVLKNQADRNDMIAGHLENVKSAPAEGKQDAYAAAVNDLIQKGYAKQGQLPDQYPGDDKIDMIEKTFMGQKQIVDQELKNRQTNSDVAKNTAQASEANAAASAKSSEALWYQQHPNAGAPGVPPETASAADWLAKPENKGKSLSDYNIAMKKIVPAYNFSLQQGNLTDQAKDMAAENYFQTGQLPSGMRSPAMSGAIISRAAQLHPNATTELAGNRAAYEANKKSYDNVTGTLDTLSSFEQSGLKNLKQFTDLASKLPDTGVPWLNTPVRNLNQNLVGAEYMPAIEAARGVALREIARVTNDPKLSGSLTDSARGEVSNFSPENATLPQIKHVVEVLTNDMANVHSSLAQQKADIGTRLGIKTQGSAPSVSVGQQVTIKGKSMKVTAVHSDGSFDAE